MTLATPRAPTPMIAQYLALKKEAEEALLLFRMGDFYELFFEDAVVAAEELDIALTTRGEHDGEPVPMCGVPFHAHESYVARLVKAGFAVAIAEQMEDPKTRKTKGPVHRAIVRILTAGTLTEERLLDAGEANWLLAAFPVEKEVGLAWIDISTGAFFMATVPHGQLADEIARINPAETLWPEGGEHRGRLLPTDSFNSRRATRTLCERFGVRTLDGFGQFDRLALAAAGALLFYLEETARGAPIRISSPVSQGTAEIMAIDSASRRSLEILTTISGERSGSLLASIDRTVTPGGARLLATEIASPLTHLARIEERLDLVQWFMGDQRLRHDVRHSLRKTPDLARVLGRIVAGRNSPRDLANIRDGVAQAHVLAEMLKIGTEGGAPDLLITLGARLATCGNLLDLLQRALAETPPHLASDGGVIKAGFDKELDALRLLATDSRTAIAALEQELRDSSGISTLKIRHNNVIGYHVEVPARHADKLLEDNNFTHRQTMANTMRFDTGDLRTLASQILDAQANALSTEATHIDMLTEAVLGDEHALSLAADALAAIDRSAALAERANEGNWCRPKLTDEADFHITAGRHPVVEQALANNGEVFVPNDCRLEDTQKVWLVTGPNMGGKSTFLRQNALFAILAQMGSYVPAADAVIGIADRVACRVGASDNLAEGRSTFMVEMVETAALLNTASNRSILLLDEVGRGTATWDGLALAWAILESIHDHIGARCLFASHYHELAQLDERLQALAVKTMRVREWQGELLFLHEVGDGAAAGSFGLQVARLAGVPEDVLRRAAEILERLEAGNIGASARDLLADLPLFASAPASAPAGDSPEEQADPVRDKLSLVQPDLLTPRAALDLLYELVELAKTETRR